MPPRRKLISKWRGRRGISLSKKWADHYAWYYREHVDFSESTEEIAPLTEEEKKAKLEELRAKNAEKKAKQAILDKEEQRKNEVFLHPLSFFRPTTNILLDRKSA